MKNVFYLWKIYAKKRSEKAFFAYKINKKAASKSNGIHELAQKLGIKDDEVMIFGDQGNDMSMFENFDFKKIAMGNAIEAIKEKADFVTKTNDEAGIAYAINKFVF